MKFRKLHLFIILLVLLTLSPLSNGACNNALEYQYNEDYNETPYIYTGSDGSFQNNNYLYSNAERFYQSPTVGYGYNVDCFEVKVYGNRSSTNAITLGLYGNYYGETNLTLHELSSYTFDPISNSFSWLDDIIYLWLEVSPPVDTSSYDYLTITIQELIREPNYPLRFAWGGYNIDRLGTGVAFQKEGNGNWVSMDSIYGHNDLYFTIYGSTFLLPTPTPTVIPTTIPTTGATPNPTPTNTPIPNPSPTPNQSPTPIITQAPVITPNTTIPLPDYKNPPSDNNISTGEVGNETKDWKNITSDNNGSGSIESWSGSTINNVTSGIRDINSIISNRSGINTTGISHTSNVIISAGILNVIPDELWAMCVLIIALSLILNVYNR